MHIDEMPPFEEGSEWSDVPTVVGCGAAVVTLYTGNRDYVGVRGIVCHGLSMIAVECSKLEGSPDRPAEHCELSGTEASVSGEF